MVEWISENWIAIVVAAAILLVSYVIGVLVRRLVFRAFNTWRKKTDWEGGRFVVQATWMQFLNWIMIIGAFSATYTLETISGADRSIISLVYKALFSLFVISFLWAVGSLIGKLIRHYTGKIKLVKRSTAIIVNAVRVVIAFFVILIVLDIWGISTTPIALALFTVIIILIFVFRDVVANFSSGFQLARGQQLEIGDFIRLETGDEGYVSDISWNMTSVRGLDGNLILIPNSRLVQTTVINYGRPLKKAVQPFRFYAHAHLKEITGRKAHNLTELLQGLDEVSGSVIYYHTHHFLEEHQYLSPEPANDFALWITDELTNELLGEKVAGIDTFAFPTIAALRARIISVIKEYLEANQDNHTVDDDRAFYFIKSVSYIFQTAFVAHDLREFVEVLNRISIHSLSYHMFEARLRLKKGVNDFSIWIEESLGDKELADSLASLDPYLYTLEGLRTQIIELVQKRISR